MCSCDCIFKIFKWILHLAKTRFKLNFSDHRSDTPDLSLETSLLKFILRNKFVKIYSIHTHARDCIENFKWIIKKRQDSSKITQCVCPRDCIFKIFKWILPLAKTRFKLNFSDHRSDTSDLSLEDCTLNLNESYLS